MLREVGILAVTRNDTAFLSDLASGELGTVVELSGGHGFVGRMAALGFTPGVSVQVVRNHGHGPIIVSLLDTQIALGRGQARRVRVRRKG
ncbi:MAG TPA: ferrous iron transport protein A [Anaerolineae bacterium]|nr:ferrous iron transport protein A [Anaerolineae bacterium]